MHDTSYSLGIKKLTFKNIVDNTPTTDIHNNINKYKFLIKSIPIKMPVTIQKIIVKQPM
jgi:hypothetical protein